jgi:hypothetical protein
MTDEFAAIIGKQRRRIAMLKNHFDTHGRIIADCSNDPGYRIVLTRGFTAECAYQVTSFRDGVPVGHREYDQLQGGGPTQNALSEFAGDVWVIK